MVGNGLRKGADNFSPFGEIASFNENPFEDISLYCKILDPATKAERAVLIDILDLQREYRDSIVVAGGWVPSLSPSRCRRCMGLRESLHRNFVIMLE